MKTLLGEPSYFSAELKRLIAYSTQRLEKVMKIQSDLLRIEQRSRTEMEQETLGRVRCFIKTELILRKQHQIKLNEAKFINN